MKRPVAGSRVPRARRWGRSASTVLLGAGALLVADAAVTLGWKEPLTALLATRQQAALVGELDALEARPLARQQRRALADLRGDHQRIAFLARALARQAPEGSAVGELRLPRLGTRQVIVRGTRPADLRDGPGTFSGVALPGARGTAAIAGHRTTYGAPFRHLDRLRPGDRVLVDMPYAHLSYRVERTRIVAPDDLSVLARTPTDRLVLSACHPLYSAAQRIVVSARLVHEVPAGALS